MKYPPEKSAYIRLPLGEKATETTSCSNGPKLRNSEGSPADRVSVLLGLGNALAVAVGNSQIDHAELVAEISRLAKPFERFRFVLGHDLAVAQLMADIEHRRGVLLHVAVGKQTRRFWFVLGTPRPSRYMSASR
jgi:hypothetical protein